MHQGDVFLLTKGLSGRGTAKDQLLEPPGAGESLVHPLPCTSPGERKTVAIASSCWQ